VKVLVRLALSAAIGIAVMALLLYRGIVRFNYPDLRTCPMQGVDVSQARSFLAALADVTGSGLPPAVDLEFGGNCGHRPREQEFIEELDSFLEQVKRATGCTPVLYVTQDFHRPYVAGRIEGYPLWVRNIFRRPRLHEGADWLLWQYANRGRMPGVGTFIDLNVYSGSAAEFREFRCPRA
jgi:lysozyme